MPKPNRIAIPGSGSLTVATFGAANIEMVQAKDPNSSDSIPTTYYINIEPAPPPELRDQLAELKDSVDLFNTWVTIQAQDVVSKRVKTGVFSANKPAELEFRSKVIDTIHRERSPWLINSLAVNYSGTVTIGSPTSHLDITKLVLAGFPVGKRISDSLEKTMALIRDRIATTSKDTTANHDYWFQATWYEYDPVLKKVEAKIRTINCKASWRTRDVKSSARFWVKGTTANDPVLEMAFLAQQSIFNQAVWRGVEDSIKDKINQRAQSMAMFDPSYDVVV